MASNGGAQHLRLDELSGTRSPARAHNQRSPPAHHHAELGGAHSSSSGSAPRTSRVPLSTGLPQAGTESPTLRTVKSAVGSLQSKIKTLTADRDEQCAAVAAHAEAAQRMKLALERQQLQHTTELAELREAVTREHYEEVRARGRELTHAQAEAQAARGAAQDTAVENEALKERCAAFERRATAAAMRSETALAAEAEAVAKVQTAERDTTAATARLDGMSGRLATEVQAAAELRTHIEAQEAALVALRKDLRSSQSALERAERERATHQDNAAEHETARERLADQHESLASSVRQREAAAAERLERAEHAAAAAQEEWSRERADFVATIATLRQQLEEAGRQQRTELAALEALIAAERAESGELSREHREVQRMLGLAVDGMDSAYRTSGGGGSAAFASADSTAKGGERAPIGAAGGHEGAVAGGRATPPPSSPEERRLRLESNTEVVALRHENLKLKQQLAEAEWGAERKVAMVTADFEQQIATLGGELAGAESAVESAQRQVQAAEQLHDNAATTLQKHHAEWLDDQSAMVQRFSAQLQAQKAELAAKSDSVVALELTTVRGQLADAEQRERDLEEQVHRMRTSLTALGYSTLALPKQQRGGAGVSLSGAKSEPLSFHGHAAGRASRTASPGASFVEAQLEILQTGETRVPRRTPQSASKATPTRVVHSGGRNINGRHSSPRRGRPAFY